MGEKKEGKEMQGRLQNIALILKERTYKKSFIVTALILLVVYTFLYGFWKIPILGFGINRLSAIGFSDYAFVLAVVGLSALFLVLFKYERNNAFSSHSATGNIGVGFTGILSAICPVCQSIGIVGLGSTLLNIPLGPLTPYLGILKMVSVGLLGLAVFLKTDSIYTRTCTLCAPAKPRSRKHAKHEPLLFRSNALFGAVAVLVLLLFVNQLLIPKVFASVAIGAGGTATIGKWEYGPKITLKPMPLATGEQPVIPGYKTRVKPLPTISELAMRPTAGEAVQDLLNNVVPSGTPLYGPEAGVTFDDPIAAQNRWATYRSLPLSPGEQERWNRIANAFTCDYCCGSPQNPTIITRCGCAHAAAAQGMAKWFIKNYGSNYSDEEIYGEMARWYALWYPKGTIERIILEAQNA
ncbi:hypothetical protein HYS48_01060 [Candidatus Woesearchaeota archaeon]|nr:hypothetical protein [Candidatus Woesearchaeota archaeon]